MELLRDMLSFYLSYIGPALDILLLAFLMYKSYQILIKTQAAQLGKGALLMLLIYAVAFLLHLTTLLWILNMLATGVVIGAAIIFQPELRRMFLTMGQNDWFRRSRSQHSHIDYVLTAAERLSAERRGMLVIFLRQNNLKEINDNLGHSYGDLAIKTIGAFLKENIADSDVYRVGGDEFIIITKQDFSYKDVDMLKKQNIEIDTAEGKIKLDYAIGYDVFDPSSTMDIDDVLKSSDKKMYENKKLYKLNK